MSEDKNPYIEPENYFEGYQDSIEKLKQSPEYVEFDRLCHLVFSTPDGKHLIEEIEKRYLVASLCSPTTRDFKTMLVYTEGFRNAFRFIINCILSHEQRIKAEIK